MRVVCTLRRIKEQAGLLDADLVRELRMHPRTVQKLLADSEEQVWRLDRAALHRLILFTHSQGGAHAFEVIPHPIWRTFVARQDEIAVFRGTRSSDAPIEEFLNRYLAQIGSHDARLKMPTTCEEVKEAMMRSNCLFIGSPKANPASEMALALLWGAEPFNDQAANRARIPIQFLGMAPEHVATSAVLRAGAWHGFEIKTRSADQPRLFPVDWFLPEIYGSYRGPIKDGAVVAACLQPLGTREPVATVVIAGYTGLSSMLVAHEAAYGSLPDFDPQTAPGRPRYALMRVSYQKRGENIRSTDITRIVEEDEVKWTLFAAP